MPLVAPYLVFSTISLSIVSLTAILLSFSRNARQLALFAYNCFLKPLRGTSQAEKLESFYSGQAAVYDDTRGRLLKGRETMLQLVASHLKAQDALAGARPRVAGGKQQKRIWVDIGGGTGWNVERMDAFLPISSFDAVYVVDLCAPLLDVARRRFAKKGWKNVHVLHQDASQFTLPEWADGSVDPRGSLALVTMSYSLSMIPTYLETLDRIDQSLNPQSGLLGVVDFYSTDEAGGTARERAIGTNKRKVGFFSSLFWTAWFSFDHVHLGICRRNYLEYKFGTVKSYNGRNNLIIPGLIQIPYYVFLGANRHRADLLDDQGRKVLALAENPIGEKREVLVAPPSDVLTPVSPWQDGSAYQKISGTPPDLSLGDSLWQDDHEGRMGAVAARLSPFDYQIRKSSWRIPYSEQHIHNQFRTHIYGWTWEDPECDINDLDIKDGDSLLVITSAGDNVLHYAIRAKVDIQSVDMNPCQGHILELKLAAIQALDYSDFWLLFGEGRHPDFERLLSSKIAPYLSAQAYAYWKVNAKEFSSNFFLRGYSGWGIRLGKIAFAIGGVTNDVKRLISASTTAEQDRIWQSRLRPIIMNPILKFILGHPIFCWNALGVPRNQLACLLEDGTITDFISATLDPVPKLATLKNGAYHYFLCLNGRYTRASCPLYLTPEGFSALKASAGARTKGIQLHTDTILNVLRELDSESLTKIIVMDSLDWFDKIPATTPLPTAVLPSLEDVRKNSPEQELEALRTELDYEILEMKRVLKKGGHAIWRSAGKYPWYKQRFELAGFRIEPVAIRENGNAIDRVNMYASLWRAEKL